MVVCNPPLKNPGHATDVVFPHFRVVCLFFVPCVIKYVQITLGAVVWRRKRFRRRFGASMEHRGRYVRPQAERSHGRRDVGRLFVHARRQRRNGRSVMYLGQVERSPDSLCAVGKV